MHPTPYRKIGYAIATLSIVIPILVMLWDVQIGAPLLLLGLFISYRAIQLSGQENAQSLSDAEMQRLSRHESERSRVIQVQLVDDYGRELSPGIAQKRMQEARSKASPRDTVVGVHFILQKEDKNQDKE